MPVIPIADYIFDPEAESITFNEYAAQGIVLERILYVHNVTRKQTMYTIMNAVDGTVDGNVLTLDGVDMSEMEATDKLYIKYDDPDYVQLVQSDTPLDSTADSVATKPADTIPVNLTASGIVAALPNTLAGMIVNSFTPGATIKLWDSPSAASGPVLNGTMSDFTALDYVDLGAPVPTYGIYAQISGTIDVTFYKYPYIENEEGGA